MIAIHDLTNDATVRLDSRRRDLEIEAMIVGAGNEQNRFTVCLVCNCNGLT